MPGDSFRVMLCIPPLNTDMYTKQFGGLLKIATSLIPQGVCHLASACRDAGFETKILDCQALQLGLGQALQKIVEFDPHLVGISATTLSILQAASLAKAIKERLPKTKTVVGGYHVSAMPEETLKEFPGFDVGVVGEGELSMLSLINALLESKDLATVEGLVYRSGEKILKTPRRPLIKDIDTLPLPAWDLLPKLSQYYGSSAQRYRVFPVASVITSRGCPHKCTFCDRSVFGTSFRGHSAEYVLEMIRTLKGRHGIKSLVFNDDLFIANKKRLREICEAMVRERFNMSWSCDGRVDRLDDETLLMMKRAGCWQLAVGIESGDQGVLEKLNKGIDLKMVSEAVRSMKRAGMSVKGFFVMGTPYDTRETLQKTIDFIQTLPLDEIQITAFTPFPGTELYEHIVKEEGYVPRWDLMNTAAPSYAPPGLTKEELIGYQREGYKKFYFRPRAILYQIAKLRSPRFAVRMIQEAFHFLLYAMKR